MQPDEIKQWLTEEEWEIYHLYCLMRDHDDDVCGKDDNSYTAEIAALESLAESRELSEQRRALLEDAKATIDRLWGVLQKGLAYDIAIQEHAKQKKSWVQSDELDRLYNEWITAIRQSLDEEKE